MVRRAILEGLNFNIIIFKASALWANAFYKLICPYVCVSVYLLTFEVLFKRLFAPTSQSRMSNISGDSESLEKEVVSEFNKITIKKRCKIAAHNFFFVSLANLCLINH